MDDDFYRELLTDYVDISGERQILREIVQAFLLDTRLGYQTCKKYEAQLAEMRLKTTDKEWGNV